MKFYNLGLQDHSTNYFLDRISGSLVQIPTMHNSRKEAFPEKLNQSLGLCHQPYGLNWEPFHSTPIASSTPCAQNLSTRARRMVQLCRSNFFWLASLYGSLVRPRFEDCSSAIAFFRQQKFAFPQHTLCLSRSLFAASASRRFAEAGVLFIGVFLPSRSMHAWIIEDGRQPDIDDSMWLNFRPVAAFC